jgi:hypothetical protein
MFHVHLILTIQDFSLRCDLNTTMDNIEEEEEDNECHMCTFDIMASGSRSHHLVVWFRVIRRLR